MFGCPTNPQVRSISNPVKLYGFGQRVSKCVLFLQLVAYAGSHTPEALVLV